MQPVEEAPGVPQNIAKITTGIDLDNDDDEPQTLYAQSVKILELPQFFQNGRH